MAAGVEPGIGERKVPSVRFLRVAPGGTAPGREDVATAAIVAGAFLILVAIHRGFRGSLG